LNEQRRAAVVDRVSNLMTRNPGASIDEITREAKISRATFYRLFRSRADLMATMDIEPDPDTRERVLASAAELISRDGLRAMNMDEVATRAGVSRASVYRLYPGKAALFDALVARYSPFDEIVALLERSADVPPGKLLPEIAQTAARVVGPRSGIARALFFEVSSLSPDALPGADPRIERVLRALSRYVASQMASGRLRPMHPLLAVQMLIGPILFHLMTRSEIERLGVLDVPLETAVNELAQGVVRALSASPVKSGG
jgi:AcrR family transcriptional regulator